VLYPIHRHCRRRCSGGDRLTCNPTLSLWH